VKKLDKQEPSNESRRGFLKTLAIGSAAAAAAVGASRAGAAVEQVQPEEPKGKQGYRETQHIKDYYSRAE
jgi:nitrous oxide reductase